MRTIKKAAAPVMGATAPTQHTRRNPTTVAPSAARQRETILADLREARSAGRTTIELRHGLGVMHPAARIQELRGDGYKIVTRWDNDSTPDGVTHRVARYVLVRTGGRR